MARTEEKASRPEEFRALGATEIRVGPKTGLRVRIQRLRPKDFIELGSIPGMFPEDDRGTRRRRVKETIEGDPRLQFRMAKRILSLGIAEPKVVETAEEIEDPETTITIDDLGADAEFYLNEICELSGLREKKRRPFRRLFPRRDSRRDG